MHLYTSTNEIENKLKCSLVLKPVYNRTGTEDLLSKLLSLNCFGKNILFKL